MKIKEIFRLLGLIAGILCVMAYFVNARTMDTWNPLIILRDGLLRAVSEPTWQPPLE